MQEGPVFSVSQIKAKQNKFCIECNGFSSFWTLHVLNPDTNPVVNPHFRTLKSFAKLNKILAKKFESNGIF
jgi:hypothetical protein